MHRTLPLALAVVLLSACQDYQTKAVVYYNFERLADSADGFHYEHFAEVNDAAVRLGCFVVEPRQVDCRDTDTNTGLPRLRPAVVSCADCTCSGQIVDPCEDNDPTTPPRPMVTDGEIVGTVDHIDGILRAGGAEFPTSIHLENATEVFLVEEPNDQPDPEPAGQVIAIGDLVVDGAVLRGTLESTTARPIGGIVSVLPVSDGVSI